MLRVAVYDIETSDLAADVGRILCVSLMSFPSGEVITFRNDKIRKKKNMADDATIAEMLRDELEKHHAVVTWNGKNFDWPFVQTRLAAAGRRVTRPLLHIDPMWQFKGWRGIKTRNAKLATAAEFFDLPERKMDVDVKVWIDAALGGDSKAMDILCERCESDVRLLAEVAQKIFDTGLISRIERYP